MQKKSSSSTFGCVGRYTLTRLLTLFFTMVVGVCLTIMIANMGGYVDTIMKDQIRDTVTTSFMSNKAYQRMNTAIVKTIGSHYHLGRKSSGVEYALHGPQLPLSWERAGLNLGSAQNMTADNGSRQVRLIILGRLPATLLLMGTWNYSCSSAPFSWRWRSPGIMAACG